MFAYKNGDPYLRLEIFLYINQGINNYMEFNLFYLNCYFNPQIQLKIKFNLMNLSNKSVTYYLIYFSALKMADLGLVFC